MKFFLCLALIFPFAAARAADSAEALVQQALAAEARFDCEAALGLFLKADAARPNDPFVLQKISKQYSDSMADISDPTEKRRRAEQALAYAQRAVALEPKSAVNVLSVAISYGKLGLCSSTRDEIAYSYQVKNYAERALDLDPNYDWAYHVLGRWHYEIAGLSGTTRFFAKLIYGGLPDASPAEAVRLLRRAVELSPQSPAHHADLGFACLVDKQPGLARAEFERALALPQREKYDEEAKRRAQAALAKLK